MLHQGVLASSKDLVEAFGSDDQEKVLRHILEKGEYHVRPQSRSVFIALVLTLVFPYDCTDLWAALG